MCKTEIEDHECQGCENCDDCKEKTEIKIKVVSESEQDFREKAYGENFHTTTEIESTDKLYKKNLIV
jgi:hypothetical protein